MLPAPEGHQLGSPRRAYQSHRGSPQRGVAGSPGVGFLVSSLVAGVAHDLLFGGDDDEEEEEEPLLAVFASAPEPRRSPLLACVPLMPRGSVSGGHAAAAGRGGGGGDAAPPFVFRKPPHGAARATLASLGELPAPPTTRVVAEAESRDNRLTSAVASSTPSASPSTSRDAAAGVDVELQLTAAERSLLLNAAALAAEAEARRLRPGQVRSPGHIETKHNRGASVRSMMRCGIKSPSKWRGVVSGSGRFNTTAAARRDCGDCGRGGRPHPEHAGRSADAAAAQDRRLGRAARSGGEWLLRLHDDSRSCVIR
jgi:hypothetical protein